MMLNLRVHCSGFSSKCEGPMLLGWFVAWAIALAGLGSAAAQPLTQHQQRALDIFRELVEIDTVVGVGDTARAAEAMAARLRAAGFAGPDAQVLVSAPRKGNLVARLRGTGRRRPILLLAHIDVVGAKREDWTVDPFRFTERDGYFYGRGTTDNKYMAAAFVANLIRYKQEGYTPERDIIVALETDEEIFDAYAVGIRWLLANHRPLIDAEFALNEGGRVGLKHGKALWNSVQVSEKVIVSYKLEVKDKGGHSSLPTKDNPIYRLSEALVRLSNFNFPFKLSDTTRAFFEQAAGAENPQTAADMRAIAAGRAELQALAITRLSANPFYNAQLRTTCVATQLEGGHAVNALPQTARATINCRVLPGEPIEEVEATLKRVLADERISITPFGVPVLSTPSALHAEILGAIEKVSAEFWPGTPVIPIMSAGATDSTYLRNAGIPAYGHSGLADDVDDFRAHGKDERVPAKSFHDGHEYLYRLVKMLAGGGQASR
jgi:acetylornithine deacetylase/succinyl-diaminopimelate desuccinylase-like protein